MKRKSFILLLLIVFCLVGLEAQTALLYIKPSDTSSSFPFPCQGHTCGCNDADDCRNHCCCSSTPRLDMPVKTGVSYFVQTLHCRGVHTDVPVNHLTQYEPLIELKANFGDVLLTILPTHIVKKPLEPCLSPPYNPPEIPS